MTIINSDNHIEPTLQADLRNRLQDDTWEAATGHCLPEFPFIFPDDGSIGLDFDDQMQAVEERLFLFLTHGDGIERQIRPSAGI